MPQDPNVPPGQSNGPFSRYLTAPLYPAQQADEPTPQQRPSGLMGTSGKLAMFGAALLKGLQQGKMASYARREQEVNTQWEKDARLVQTVQDSPEIPDDVKTQAALWLGQEYKTLAKDQVDAIKKHHGKAGSGIGSHILGAMESVFDKLGGPTPALHGLEGGGDENSTDKRNARDKLYELIAHTRTADPRFNLTARYDQSETALNDVIKQKGLQTSRDIAQDPDAGKHIAIMQQQPKRWKLTADRLQEAYRIPADDETVNEEYYRQLQNQRKPGTPAAPPREQPDASGITQPPPTGSPVLANPTGPTTQTFTPWVMPDGFKVETPELERLALRRVSGDTKQQKVAVQYKHQEKDPNGEMGWKYSKGMWYPKYGITIDEQTNRRMNIGKGWEQVTAEDRPHYTDKITYNPDGSQTKTLVDLKEGPVTYMPEPKTRLRTEDVGGKRYQYDEDIRTHKEVPETRKYVGPEPGSRGRGGRGGTPAGPKPMTESKKTTLGTQRDAFYKREHQEWEKKAGYDAAAEANVGETIINPESKSGGTIKVTPPLKKEWARRAKEAAELAKDLQRQSREKQKELDAANGPPAPTPAPSHKPPKRGKLTDPKMVQEYLKKAGGDPDKATELAQADGWEM